MAKFKLKDDSLTVIEVHYLDGTAKNFYSIDKDGTTGGQLDQTRGIAKLERAFLANSNWKYARLIDTTTGEILGYYHQNTGLQRLNVDEYKAQFRSASAVNLYIIPNTNGKQRGFIKPRTVQNIELDDVATYWNTDVWKIQAYRNNKLVGTYNGKVWER